MLKSPRINIALLASVIALAVGLLAGYLIKRHIVEAALDHPEDPRAAWETNFALGRDIEAAVPTRAWSQDRPLNSWQAGAREKLLQLLGVPELDEARVGITTESSPKDVTDLGSVERHRIGIAIERDLMMPCYLFVPKGASGRLPAIVVIPGHGEGIIETAGIKASYQRGNAKVLAQAGFVTLTCELRGMSKTFGWMEHRKVAYNALVLGKSYLGLVMKDVRKGINYLRQHENVDPERIGITGVSFGGEAAYYAAAIFDDLKAAVVMGFVGYAELNRPTASNSENLLRSHLCHLIPGIVNHFESKDIALLIAPRPLLISRGRDERTDWLRLEDDMNLVQKGYENLGGAKRFAYRFHEGGHVYDLESAQVFFDTHL